MDRDTASMPPMRHPAKLTAAGARVGGVEKGSTRDTCNNDGKDYADGVHNLESTATYIMQTM